MNKQELIDILENLECSTESLSYDNGYEQGVYDSLSHVILLDEPKKVVVPKFVADFIEDGNHYDKIAFLVHQKYLGINSLMRECPVKDWLMSVDYETVLSLVNGYEVEKEQLYYVLLPEMGEYESKYFLDQDGELSVDNQLCEYYKLTEQEIKSIDERYWPFAVKV
ncbi:TPA: DUF1642 domain-containing protein [Enterococcus faecalis]|uniref:DUF1642 domain-containing protein n=1 Tax=Enterococcus faecalis TaxID=1351 RepID=UPI0012E30F66|nr:DUF1642 domain-containing protein [Enterococcus faecalis]MDU6566506.1 DUF1642 domain-containing protein [Enterococcus faecalis]MUN46086.1 DUF1642 domain-containing protein [Enterococcus faecalis]HCT6962728.1 DUF1642 domain-containing protein [Enterococcus faecalis]HCY8956399.1 DUF1642 domain-containing protein [Enterococcus faecalis]HCY9034373.1 DUF1642 domain-containing protein [Enterococcus faecalis]